MNYEWNHFFAATATGGAGAAKPNTETHFLISSQYDTHLHIQTLMSPFTEAMISDEDGLEIFS